MKSFANNTTTIKNENRALILNLIRRFPVSRAEISKITGLSKSSVTMITNALIGEGLLKEIGTDDSSVGRKPILLDIVADYRFAAGIILHRREIKVCLTDLKGEVLCCTVCSIENFASADAILDYTAGEVINLIEQSGRNREDCIGIGISCPGPIDSNKGIILSPPHLNLLHNVCAADEIKRRTGMNVVLENNAVLLAMRENVLRGNNLRNFMSVIVWHGIGSAVVTDGEIYRGALGFSGELGHISVVAGGLKCPCGNNGCLERYVSLSAVKEHFGFTDYKAVVDRAENGDTAATDVLKYISEYLGSGLVTAVNLFDLDAIILHGDYSYNPAILKKLLKTYINENSVVAATHNVDVIIPSDRGERAEGNSTAAILKQYFDQNLED